MPFKLCREIYPKNWKFMSGKSENIWKLSRVWLYEVVICICFSINLFDVKFGWMWELKEPNIIYSTHLIRVRIAYEMFMTTRRSMTSELGSYKKILRAFCSINEAKVQVHCWLFNIQKEMWNVTKLRNFPSSLFRSLSNWKQKKIMQTFHDKQPKQILSINNYAHE